MMKSLTKRQIDFVETLIAEGGTLKDAARLAGYKDGPGLKVTASRIMKHPHVQAYLMQRINETLSVGAAKAIHRIVKLISEAKSERVQLDASRDILDRAGFKPPERFAVQIAGDMSVSIDLS
jgi:phage terminase small subunit